MPSIFSKIIDGTLPCHKVHEDEKHLAFLDIQPLVMGHVLCIPKKEVDYIFDLSPDDLANLWKFSQTVAHALKHAVPCKRIGTAVIGLEVPHAHVHLVPMNQVGDLNFSLPKLHPSNEELAQIASEIRGFLNS